MANCAPWPSCTKGVARCFPLYQPQQKRVSPSARRIRSLALWHHGAHPLKFVDKLNKAINEELSTPAMQTAITALGSEVIPNSPAEFATYIAMQGKRWIEVGKAAGVRVN